MGPPRFDGLTRSLGTRPLGRRLLVGAAVATTRVDAALDAEARRRRKRKKKKQKTPQCDVCAKGCPFATVQAAVDAAAPGAAIRICAGTYPGRVTIAKSLSLLGQGSDPAATVLTDPTGPVLLVTAGVVAARNLTVTGVSGSEAGISNAGDLTLDRVRVTGNTNVNEGGGIINGASPSAVTLIDSEVRGNAAFQGGGIFNLSGVVVLVRTRVEGNQAGQGGGIFNFSGSITLADATAVTGNSAVNVAPAGGGIFNNRVVFLIGGSSVSGNSPDQCVDAGAGTGCP